MNPARRTLLRALAVAGGAVLLAGGAAALYLAAPRHTPEGQPPLASLRDGIGPLREAFDAASDRTRLLVLLSPT